MALTKKALTHLVDKIEDALKGEILKRDRAAKLSVGPENGDNIHILIISSLFSGLDFSERDNIVWPVLEKALEDSEIVHISLCMLLAPDEVPVGIAI